MLWHSGRAICAFIVDIFTFCVSDRKIPNMLKQAGVIWCPTRRRNICSLLFFSFSGFCWQRSTARTKHVSVTFAGNRVSKIVCFFALPNSPFALLHPPQPSGPEPRAVVGWCRWSAVWGGSASSSSQTCAQGSTNTVQKGAAGNWNLELYRHRFAKTQTLVEDNKTKVSSLTQPLWCCNRRPFPASSNAQYFSPHSASWKTHSPGSSCHMSLRQTDR